MKQVEVYTDGACSGNPGPGGWGAILRYNGVEKELSGFEAGTTNNRMELKGAIYALEALKEPCEVLLYTDSQYIAKAINEGWLRNWKRNGWKKAIRNQCSTWSCGKPWMPSSSGTRCRSIGSKAMRTTPTTTAATSWPPARSPKTDKRFAKCNFFVNR